MVKVYVIHGPPLSGKTTYVQKHKGPNDLIYDFDYIMSVISGLPVHKHNTNLIGYVLDIRDLIINRLKREKRLDKAWIITTRLRKDLIEQLKGLDVEYIHLKVDKETQLKRLKENPDGRDIAEWTALINSRQEINERKKFYKSKEWLKVRQLALERDNYECQHCKVRGEVSKAECVHHIQHVKDKPELALDLDNLVSLCYACHNLEHKEKIDKFRENWRTKINAKEQMIPERW